MKVDSSSNDPLDPIRSFLLTRNLRALENSPLSQTLMKSPRLFKPKLLKKSAEKDSLFDQALLKPRLLKKSEEKDLLLDLAFLKPRLLKKSAEKDQRFDQILFKPRLLKKSEENDLTYPSYMRL